MNDGQTLTHQRIKACQHYPHALLGARQHKPELQSY